jgi:hypothetical protein
MVRWERTPGALADSGATMNLIVLGSPIGPYQNPAYRGVDRAHAWNCDALPKDHEINVLFYWYLEEGGEFGLVHDFAKARRFAELWNERLGSDRFEIVEVTEDNAAPVGVGELLGFDIAAGYHFSLAGVARMDLDQLKDVDKSQRTLLELLIAHFASTFNSKLLFETYEDAALCLRVMRVLNALWPNSFEEGDLSEFKVLGLYRVWPK